MSKNVEIPVFILGPGNVGGELLRQILASRMQLLDRKNIHIKIIGMNSRSMRWYDPNGFSDSAILQILDKYNASRCNGSIVPALPIKHLPSGCVVVDTTASDETAPLLYSYLQAGCGVVLANKKPLSNPWREASIFFENPCVRREATVCAGLPIIYTLNYLQNTGDHVVSIEGNLSGTLGFLCAQLRKGITYSQAVLAALKHGYTEPDPRDDLNGQDVARKILILARTAGFQLELENIIVESLIPNGLGRIPTDRFLEHIPEADNEFAEKSKYARSRGKCLQYVARVDEDGGSASLKEVDNASISGTLQGPESYVAVTTERYKDNPLIITGPGSGPAITAAAVYQDVLDLGIQMQ